jgi:4'-phosphopantetheinyl transferase
MHYPSEPVILLHKIDFANAETDYPSLFGKIRKAKQEKLEKFKFREDKLRCLFGELLVKYAFDKYYGIEYSKEIIFEDKFGKPYLKDKQISFNISHSGNWAAVVCYVNDAGIDVEKMENPPYEILTDTFTQDEIAQIENCPPRLKACMFYKMWTLKESYIKMLGQGLSIPLHSFSINAGDENNITVQENSHPAEGVHFRLFTPDAGHASAVCLRGYDKEVLPRIISLDQLLHNQ